ncbi:MAG: exonuclease SbcCD subunit D [Armatimonadota bacterium]
MRAIHTADWHLSAQRNRVDAETGLNARLIDFYRCARFTIDDGLKRGAGLVLHAGDAFHGCRPTPSEVRLLREALRPALEAGVPVVLLLGNHDAPRSPAEKHALDLVRETPGLLVIDRPVLLNVWEGHGPAVVDLADLATPDGRDLALQLACLPWPNKQLLLADEEYRRLDPGQLNEAVRAKMMDCLAGLAAQLLPGVPAVLLAHLSIDLAQAGGMNRLMALGGEWTLNLHDVAGLGFDAVCLGHIHRAQVFSEAPWIGYAGSPEAVSFGEEGEPKSYCLLDVQEDCSVEVEQIPTPHRRFLTVEAGNGHTLPTPEELAGSIVRVRVPQAAEVDFTALRRELEAAGVHEYQVETQRAETVRRRAVAVSSEMALEEAIRAYVAQRPELQPLTDALIAEAHAIEQVVAAGGVA